MASIFTKIINRELPGHIVAEDENTIAFLDIQPLAKGHCLVVPKQEIDYYFDLDESNLTGMQIFQKRLAKSIERVVACKRIGVAIVGLEVPHAHVHLIPINNISDINFARPKLKVPESEMKELCFKIKQEFDKNTLSV